MPSSAWSAITTCLQRTVWHKRGPAAGLPRPPRGAAAPACARRAGPGGPAARARARAAAPEEGDEAGDERDDGHVDGRDAHAREHIPRAEHRPVPVQQVVVEEACARVPLVRAQPYPEPVRRPPPTQDGCRARFKHSDRARGGAAGAAARGQGARGGAPKVGRA